jgi:hypothetical protein
LSIALHALNSLPASPQSKLQLKSAEASKITAAEVNGMRFFALPKNFQEH